MTKQHLRRSVRLRDYDYSQRGAYFVTIVAFQRKCLFGDIMNGEMSLSECGKIVEEQWLKAAQMRKEIELDVFVIMPNHLHGIVIIKNESRVGAHGRAPLHRAPRSLGSLVAGFKSAATKRINGIRNYYEHIIRGERDFDAIRRYVLENPLGWARDPENPNSRTRGRPSTLGDHRESPLPGPLW
ncbi:MAG TPA: transposase [Dehalococcoidia bacterium]|nr:transposase [Dehalococcoidia bacterium]